ncbi:unnamed protein product [Prorocentrum cordatum]|uniref:Uncharacterized protein n=1 Tax=Prorocentrum cordatum TaxID=2364126 RepID=A0ABN9U342_9DINO|nr:unnamed protein product [Polarella glacialis]
MALTQAEPRLAPLPTAFEVEVCDVQRRHQKRRQTHPGYTPHHLLASLAPQSSQGAGHADDLCQPQEKDASSDNSTRSTLPLLGFEFDDSASAHEDGASEAPNSPRERPPELYPDTDSEFGDYTAVRATWRKAKVAPPPSGSAAAAGGAARAGEGSEEPPRPAGEGQPPGSTAAVRPRRCRGRKARLVQASMVKVLSTGGHRENHHGDAAQSAGQVQN